MEIGFSLGTGSPRVDSLQKDHLKRFANTSFNNHSPNWEVDDQTLPARPCFLKSLYRLPKLRVHLDLSYMVEES